MSNSPLVAYTKLSPNHSGVRTHAIDRITPHCVVGQCSVETVGEVFYPTSRQASSNYCIGSDTRIAMYVEEKNRSWCSSSNANDQRAITIECASDTTYPYALKPEVYETLVSLCVDICKRNGKNKLLWLGDKEKTLSYDPKPDEMVLTAHRWFAATECPGEWLYSRLGNLASEVTARLNLNTTKEETSNVLYRVQVGAFSKKENAENLLKQLKEAGFEGFVTSTANVTINAPKKSNEDIAKEIIKGLWGIGEERKKSLTDAGYDYNAIQNIVNKYFE